MIIMDANQDLASTEPSPPQKPLWVRLRGTKPLLGFLLFAECLLLYIDFCAPGAWSIMCLGAGLYLAILLTRNPSRWHVTTTTTILLIVPTMFTWRVLPIHSLDWTGIDRVEVEFITGNGHFEVTDPVDLKRFEHFASRGTHHTMLKSGYGYYIRVWRENVGEGFYVHGNALGHNPGGTMQSIFVPSDSGFMDWFDNLLVRHGASRQQLRASTTEP